MRDPTFPSRSKAGGFSTGSSASTGAGGTRSRRSGATNTPSHAATSSITSRASDDGDVGLTQIVGHKGDLMLTHYARTFDGLAYAQTLVDKLELREFLVPRRLVCFGAGAWAVRRNRKDPRRAQPARARAAVARVDRRASTN